MTKVVFVDSQGNEVEVAAENGASLMQAAVQNGVEGILADCGGNCACGTCHVYVDDDFALKVGGPNELEDAMLDVSNNRTERSRLACQIAVTDELEGLRVTVVDE